MLQQKVIVKRSISIFSLFLLFFLSRWHFINRQDVFFDSGEYIKLFSNSNFFQALAFGHAPPHEGYILLFWPIFQIAMFFHLNPVYLVILGQIFLAFLAIFCFYHVITCITNKRTAVVATLIASLLPLFWITNVTIMMENAYICFFFLSLYCLTRYLSQQKVIFLHLSAFLFTLAFLTHMLTLLWLPLYCAVVFYTKREKIFIIMTTTSLYLIIFSAITIVFLANMSDREIAPVIQHLYFSKGSEFAYLPFDLKGFLITMRNFLIPLLKNNTSLITLFGFVSLLVLLIKDKKLFLFGLLWIAPALYANQWWDSLLNGRHALIASFGFAFLVAYLIRKQTIVIVLVVGYLLVVSLPILHLLRQPIPYLQEAAFAQSLPKDSLFIESHFARPQVQEIQSLDFFFVNEPGFDKNTLPKKIHNALLEKRDVFISSAALSEPYGLYSGPYVHNITLSYAKPFALKEVIEQYTLKQYKIINEKDNLLIYKVVAAKPSPYPPIILLKNSHRRLDYYDPLWKVLSSY